MSQILIGQSYYLRFDSKLWEAMQPYPPLGSLYAAAYIRQKGYDVAFFDAMLAESEAAWVEALEQHRPQYAILYEDSFNYLSKMCLLRMREAAFTMTQAAKARGCTVIISGSDATDHAEKYFQHGVDFILIGEGEITLTELLGQLTGRAPKPLATINGLAYPTEINLTPTLSYVGEGVTSPPDVGGIKGGSPIMKTSPRPFERELDEFPFPAWDLVNIPQYQRIWRERHGYYSMNMVTTRGCPYRCNWCAKPIYGRRYNSRSPENVVAEMKWLKDNFQPDHIWFADDIFGLKPHWIEQFSQLAQAHDAVIPFKCLQRVDLITDTVAQALAQAKCQIVWVGAESGSQKILDAMDKDTQVEQIYIASQRLHQHGVKIGFFLQFGYLGETWEDIQLTLKMVRQCQPDDIGISVSYPLPGTKFHEKVKQELGDKTNWLDSNDLEMLYHGPYVTEFYRELHKRVHYEYRARKAWQQLKMGWQQRQFHTHQWRQTLTIPVNMLRLANSSLKLRRLAQTPSL